MTSAVRYDESLEIMVRVVRDQLGAGALEGGLVLREAAGRLAFLSGAELPESTAAELEARLYEQLGVYARDDRVLLTPSSLGASHLLQESNIQWLQVGEGRVRHLDRKVVGVDWLAGIVSAVATPPRFVFSSLKGGVGRTTAVCVAAAELARDGKNVLVVDLDLEAPGVGSILLSNGTQPRFGSIDYLAESTVSPRAAELVPEMVATSELTGQVGGRIDVVPAVGSATRPQNFLGKLSRALLDVAHDSSTLSVRKKIGCLLHDVTQRVEYDVVLIDARAGLSEITAGPLLELGAQVLLFGTAQQQTLDGYRFLFAHLASLVPPGHESPWNCLQMVQAKASPDEVQNRWFLEEVHSLFQDHLYEEIEALEGFNFDIEDREAPHYPVPIAMNPLFASWDPARRPSDLTSGFYEASFSPFITVLARRLKSGGR